MPGVSFLQEPLTVPCAPRALLQRGALPAFAARSPAADVVAFFLRHLRLTPAVLPSTAARPSYAPVSLYLPSSLKGFSSTFSLWAIHGNCHDYSGALSLRRVAASSWLHSALVASWLSFSLFFLASFSNFALWSHHALLRPFAIWALHVAGQDLLHGSGDGFFISSGITFYWRQVGVTSKTDLFTLASAGLLFSLGAVCWAYLQLHGWSPGLLTAPKQVALGGLLSTAWAAHILYVTTPATLSPALISGDTLACSSLLIAAHQASLGVACQIAGWLAALRPVLPPAPARFLHERLALQLALLGCGSLYHSFSLMLFPSFAALLSDYVSTYALWCHHVCVGLLALGGSASHGSLWMMREARPRSLRFYLAHRDHLHAHLLWAATFSGVHAFGFFVHNDTVLALGRHFDSFSDDSLCLRPLFALQAGRLFSPALLFSADSFVCMAPLEYSTPDFALCHIHSFSAHVSVFILAKGLFYSRSSRFLASKSDLGFRFPCDGPGRGGTCQVSSWDHIYLGLFWLYNLLSILLFSMFWKLEIRGAPPEVEALPRV